MKECLVSVSYTCISQETEEGKAVCNDGKSKTSQIVFEAVLALS